MREQIQAMPEGEGAGPGAPETVEPVRGESPDGPRASRADWGQARGEDWSQRTGEADSHMDPQGAAGVAVWSGLRVIVRSIGLLRGRFGRRG